MPRIRTDQEWMSIFEAQQQSGMTITAFCKEQGLSARTFQRRKSLLSHANVDNHFVKVQATEPESTPILEPVNCAQCSLHIGQVTLSFPSTVPTSWVAQLIRDIRL